MKESHVGPTCRISFLNILITPSATYQIIGIEEETDFHTSSNGCGGGGGTVKMSFASSEGGGGQKI